MIVRSARSASARAVVVDGDTYYKTDWLTSGGDRELSPTVFLVEQAPNVSLRTHFHRNNQFQLFVRGSGTRRAPDAIRRARRASSTLSWRAR